MDRSNGIGAHRFAIFSIVIGVILILSALVGGISFIIALAKGFIGHTLSGVRALILNILLEFCVPFIGGVTIIVAASRLMKMDSSLLDRRMSTESRKRETKQKEKIVNVLLGNDEKMVLDLIKEEKSGSLQSDLVIKAGYSKVKMHRILKSLENKGLIRRGRFGITNKVFINKY